MKNLAILLISILLFRCSDNNQNHSEWHLVFRNDKAGNTIYGDKSELIRFARAGYPMRVGFGGRSATDSARSVEHIADCQFLTVRNSTEVFAQITPIFGQSPNTEGTEIKFREGYQWSIIVGTNGFSDRVNINTKTDSIEGHNQRATNVSWYVNSPLSKTNYDQIKPLWE